MERRRFLSINALASVGLASEWPAFSSPSTTRHVPEQTGLTFLFQGDSITDGNRGRTADPNHIMGHGYAFGIASRIGADFPERDFVFYNRGISGNKITDLAKRWPTDTLDLKPDVLSLLIGINDTFAAVSKDAEATTPEQFEAIFRQLLTDCKQQHPAILFVLGLPFVFPVGKIRDNWVLWRDDLDKRQAIIRKLAAEFDAVLVDYPAVLNEASLGKNVEYWIWDGIHPTVFAHELMVREWLKQVRSRLKFLKKYDY